MRVHRFAEGDALVRAGESLEHVLLLLDGTVRVNAPHEAECAPPHSAHLHLLPPGPPSPTPPWLEL